jgi:hypothetical protein
LWYFPPIFALAKEAKKELLEAAPFSKIYQ